MRCGEKRYIPPSCVYPYNYRTFVYCCCPEIIDECHSDIAVCFPSQVVAEFRKHAGESDPSRQSELLQHARNYAFLLRSVREHKVGSTAPF